MVYDPYHDLGDLKEYLDLLQDKTHTQDKTSRLEEKKLKENHTPKPESLTQTAKCGYLEREVEICSEGVLCYQYKSKGFDSNGVPRGNCLAQADFGLIFTTYPRCMLDKIVKLRYYK